MKKKLSQKTLDHTNVQLSGKKNDVSSLSISRNVLTLQTANGNILILYEIILRPNIYFLSNKPKQETKD